MMRCPGLNLCTEATKFIDSMKWSPDAAVTKTTSSALAAVRIVNDSGIRCNDWTMSRDTLNGFPTVGEARERYTNGGLNSTCRFSKACVLCK